MMPMQTTYACEAVWNDFETSYNGWYGNADHVILTAQEGTGFQSAKAMQVSGRRSAAKTCLRLADGNHTGIRMGRGQSGSG